MKHIIGQTIQEIKRTYVNEVNKFKGVVTDVLRGRGKGSWGDDEWSANELTEWYDGDLLNGKRHGKGEMRWANGDYYDGEWQNGKRHGKGEMLWASGEMYDGQWLNDKRHGKGVLSFAGEYYNGDWINDMKYGKGYYLYAEESYDGE